MVLRLMACSPRRPIAFGRRRALLRVSEPRSRPALRRGLMPRAASRPHVFAVREQRGRQRFRRSLTDPLQVPALKPHSRLTPPASTASHPAVVTIANAPLTEAGRGEYNHRNSVRSSGVGKIDGGATLPVGGRGRPAKRSEARAGEGPGTASNSTLRCWSGSLCLARKAEERPMSPREEVAPCQAPHPHSSYARSTSPAQSGERCAPRRGEGQRICRLRTARLHLPLAGFQCGRTEETG